MKKVHPEFAFQSRELEGQIEGTLGDPPNRKNYDMMVQALVSEYANGDGLDDVNMMAFALVDRIRFTDPKGLVREAADYEGGGDPARALAMANCDGDDEGRAMYASICANHPELARQAIVTAFLYKNPGRWEDDDQSLDQLADGDEGDDELDETAAGDDFMQIFDQEGGERE